MKRIIMIMAVCILFLSGCGKTSTSSETTARQDNNSKITIVDNGDDMVLETEAVDVTFRRSINAFVFKNKSDKAFNLYFLDDTGNYYQYANFYINGYDDVGLLHGNTIKPNDELIVNLLIAEEDKSVIKETNTIGVYFMIGEPQADIDDGPKAGTEQKYDFTIEVSKEVAETWVPK